jgi:predicted nuclease of predicted toxin-antitoxin system
MRFKVDENLPESAADVLRRAGHDAETVRQEGLSGCRDADLYARAVAEGRALVTLDLDFADIRTYPPGSGPGVVVVRLRSQAVPSILGALTRFVSVIEREALQGHLWIVQDDRIRVA